MNKDLDIKIAMIDTLEERGFFSIRNGSAEIFIDDIGLIQKIISKKRRRRRAGEELKILSVKNGKSITSYDKDVNIGDIVYESTWFKNK